MPRRAEPPRPEPASAPAGPGPERRDARLLAVLLLAAAVATAAAHAPALTAQARAYDDNLFVGENALVLRPSWDSVRRFFGEVLEPSSVGGYYLPVTMTSLMLDVAMGGRIDDLGAFHRTQLALHLASVLLLGGIVFVLFRSPWAAGAAAMWFGLHPLTVEPVAWVSERKTLLTTRSAGGRPSPSSSAAEAEYRAILERHPDFTFALVNLGLMQSSRGLHDQAADAFRRVAPLVPGDARVAFEWGRVEKAAGRLATAESLFARAAEIDPGHVAALGQLGTVQAMRGRAADGIATLRRAIGIAPGDPQPHFALALVLLDQRGPDAEAVSHLERAAAASGPWTLPLTALAWLRATSPDPAFRDAAAALRLAEQAARIAPEATPVLDARAAALAAGGEFRAAAEVARRAEAMARRDNRHALGDEIAFRAATYEQGRAYVDTTLGRTGRR